MSCIYFFITLFNLVPLIQVPFAASLGDWDMINVGVDHNILIGNREIRAGFIILPDPM